jgi:hypothetical protein
LFTLYLKHVSTLNWVIFRCPFTVCEIFEKVHTYIHTYIPRAEINKGVLKHAPTYVTTVAVKTG